MKRIIYTLCVLTLAALPVAAQVPAPATQKAPAAEENCGCEAAPLPEVLATVNGIKITPGDLSAQTRARVAELQRQVTEARRRELDLQINSLLLEAEAKRRGVAAEKVLADEVVAKAQRPTEAEAQTFFNQNKARIEAEAGRDVKFEEVKDGVVAHLLAERQEGLAKQLSERLRAAADVKIMAREATPPADASGRARVFATVNGRPITSGDVEDSLRALVYDVQAKVHGLRSRDLELRINDVLLAQEAQRRKVTPRALLDAEVDSKVTTVTEAQAREFYDQNREKIDGEFAPLKEQIISYLRDAESRRLLVAFAETLRRGATLQTFLAAPAPPVFDVATDDQPAKGGESAAVTIVEFADFQCPSCAKLQPVLDRIVREYAGRVRLVARDYPLPQHADSFKAAEAAEAAREQGKYWEYVTKLFGNQTALGVPRLKQYATELGLDRARFDKALDGGKFSAQVRRDLLDGQKLGVDATPTLFVNGRRVGDRSYEGLKAAIEAALNDTAGN